MARETQGIVRLVVGKNEHDVGTRRGLRAPRLRSQGKQRKNSQSQKDHPALDHNRFPVKIADDVFLH
jgi:hypothetical protein